MHPGREDVAVGWRSPLKGTVAVRARVEHAQRGSIGIQWRIVRVTKAEPKTLAHGATEGRGQRKIPSAEEAKDLAAVAVEPGDMISLVVGRRGVHYCDTTLIDLVISEVGGRGRSLEPERGCCGRVHAGNPHADAQGQAGVWYFYKARRPPPFSIAAALGVGLAGRQRGGIHQGTQGQETEHHPPADPHPCRTDLARRRHGDARRQPAAPSQAACRIGTAHAGAGPFASD